MKKNNDSNPVLSLKEPWENNENSVWLASTLSLVRNIQKFKFPMKLDAERERQLIGVINKELLESRHLAKPITLHAEQTLPLQKQFLVEHFLTIESFQQAHAGEAFVIDDTGEMLITLNMHDHIHFHLLDTQGELESAWNRIVQMESSLGNSLNYMFSPKYGFLTADFNLCGTALNASVFLQIPALVHSEQVDLVLERLADDSLYITGIQGNPTEIIGDIIVAQNNYTLGVTEENIIANLRAFTTKMLVEENSAKSKIRHENSVEIKDRVSRAFGILIHSYQIEAIEALNAISLLKLGTELGWMTGITIKELNSLFFNCRQAHLIYANKAEIKQEEILHKRAEFIHKALANVKLTI